MTQFYVFENFLKDPGNSYYNCYQELYLAAPRQGPCCCESMTLIHRDEEEREPESSGKMEMCGRATFGGTDRAFSNRTTMRHEKYPGFADGETGNLPRVVSENTEPNKKRKSNRVLRPWGSLPAELIGLITSRLNIFDYFSVGGVCKSWRSPTIEYRKDTMQHQQPLVVFKSINAKRTYFLRNIFDKKSYKTMLPKSNWRQFMGLSCGYLITRDIESGYWLVDIMTRKELYFPAGPPDMKRVEAYNMRHMLFESSQDSRFCMAIVSAKLEYFVLLYSCVDSSGSGGSWVVYPLPEGTAGIVDVKIFNGKIVVLTCEGHIGELDPTTSSAVMTLHKSNIHIKNLSTLYYLQLVNLNSKICMVICRDREFSPMQNFVGLYELDQNMQWVKINDIGGKSLFVSRYNSAIVDTTIQGAGNCVCVLELQKSNIWSLYRLSDSDWLARAGLVCNGPQFRPYFWYFPQECGSISRA